MSYRLSISVAALLAAIPAPVVRGLSA